MVSRTWFPLAQAFMLSVFGLSSPAGATDSLAPLTELPSLADLPERWTQIMDLFDVPGMAVAVVQGERLYAQGFGSRDPRSGAPVTPETLFYIASITKTFTATTVCALADSKRLSLDDPVRKYLPRFQLADSSLAARVTIRDLLCHRYGIRSGPIVLLDAYTGEITEDRYYHWLAQAETAGTVEYSNVHFTVLGRVIEAVTGKSWRDELARSILAPAGMVRTTGYASQMYADPNAAVPLERVDGAWRAVEQRKTDRTMHAAGGLGSSAHELARWLRLQLQDGTLDGKRILSKETTGEMRATQSKLDEPDGSIRIIEGFGLAWSVGTFNGHRLCQHSGGYDGASAYVAFLPDDGVGVVVLLNAGGPARGLGDIAAVDVLERLTGTKSAWDVYDRFTRRARERKQTAAEEQASTPPPSSAPLLSQSPSAYVGSFSNPWWGTFEVQATEARLACRLGEMALPIGPSAAGNDHFTVADFLDENISGQFLAADGKSVESIRLLHPRFGELVFHR
ncbi:MAG TPA: serine hydrolase domain-containing protein [Candidatus Krumholzibacteria bacterium]|nr:serine hydrolase domain-containing protein [Candidatus Krumholzibacteria bacterium]